MPKNVPPLAERSGHCGGSCGRFRIKTNHGQKNAIASSICQLGRSIVLSRMPTSWKNVARRGTRRALEQRVFSSAARARERQLKRPCRSRSRQTHRVHAGAVHRYRSRFAKARRNFHKTEIGCFRPRFSCSCQEARMLKPDLAGGCGFGSYLSNISRSLRQSASHVESVGA